MSMDIKMLRLCSFRYALGRASYITNTVSTELIEHWKEMEGFQKQIQSDIKRAIETGSAGHDCDIAEWRMILDLEVTK